MTEHYFNTTSSPTKDANKILPLQDLVVLKKIQKEIDRIESLKNEEGPPSDAYTFIVYQWPQIVKVERAYGFLPLHINVYLDYDPDTQTFSLLCGEEKALQSCYDTHEYLLERIREYHHLSLEQALEQGQLVYRYLQQTEQQAHLWEKQRHYWSNLMNVEEEPLTTAVKDDDEDFQF